mgnify:CR=1 FL=1|tara:strand:- start:276 stop:1115 length:840 start_codon:yes stop_codon:yes gene_type:complete
MGKKIPSGGFSTVSSMERLRASQWSKEADCLPQGLHRKVWEVALAMETFKQAGVLKAGKRGLGFGCGVEVVPEFLARDGVEVVATDFHGGGWHKSSKESLYHGHGDKDNFDRLVSYQDLDMNWIPEKFDGQFDCAWSLCSLDHVGCILLSRRFIFNSLRCLKPGGVAVHAGEYRIGSDWDTVDYHDTVLWTWWDIRQTLALCREWGCECEFDWDLGDHELDKMENQRGLLGPEDVHLKTEMGGPNGKNYPTTSFGLVIRVPDDWDSHDTTVWSSIHIVG